MRPIGHARSPFTATSEIPKGLGARHEVEGTLDLFPELEAGLQDIEGFSHLFVLAEAEARAKAPPTEL